MLLLDTHAWIWLASEPAKLGRAVRKRLASSTPRAVAAISCWEIATLVDRKRIELDRGSAQWMDDTMQELRLELLPLTPAIAARAFQLGDAFHGDPADRLIVATALVHGATLATKDRLIGKSGTVPTLW